MQDRRVILLDQPNRIETLFANGLLLKGGAVDFALATTKQETFDFLTERPTDLVVTGLDYLDGTAEEFLKELNSHLEILTPSLLLADPSQQEQSKRAISCGVFDVIWSPSNVDLIFKHIGSAVNLFSKPKSRIENFEVQETAEYKKMVQESLAAGMSVAEWMLQKAR